MQFEEGELVPVPSLEGYAAITDGKESTAAQACGITPLKCRDFSRFMDRLTSLDRFLSHLMIDSISQPVDATS